MSFFTTITCRLPVFIQRALNRSLGSVQQDFFRILEECVSDVWSYGLAIHQAFSMYAEESQKEGKLIY